MNGVSSGLAPARASAYRRIRLAVVAASVVAAIVGSVLLATHRSSEKVGVQRGSILGPALPAGGKVVARIRVGRAVPPVRAGGALAVGEGAVWAMSNSQATLMRIDPARNAVVARIKVVYPPETVAAGDGAVWLSNPSDDTVTRIDPLNEQGHRDHPCRPESRGDRRLAGSRLGRDRGRPQRLTDRSRDESSRGDHPPSDRSAPVARST